MAVVASLVNTIRARDEKEFLRLLHLYQDEETAVDLDERTEGTTALVEAVLAGRPAMVTALLEAGASVNAGCDHAVSPLCVAAAVDSLKMAELLLKHGADIRHLVDTRPLCQVATPLHYAIEMRSFPMARLLLEHGHDPNCPSHMYKYPLSEAVRLNCPHIVRLLVASPRCKLDGRIDGYGTWNFPPLHQALFRFRRYECAQALLDAGRCSLAFQSDSYLCVLLWRARDTSYSHKRIARMLLEAGSDLYCKDRQGQTAIESFITGNRVVDLATSGALLRLVVDGGITPSPREAEMLFEHAHSVADREVADWMRDVATRPRRLRDQVRRTLRRAAGVYPMQRLRDLPLPPFLMDFVTLRYLRH